MTAAPARGTTLELEGLTPPPSLVSDQARFAYGPGWSLPPFLLALAAPAAEPDDQSARLSRIGVSMVSPHMARIMVPPKHQPDISELVPPAPKLRDSPGAKVELFKLVDTMPSSYAAVMFGLGTALLLVSAALGYSGREITLYTKEDPASFDDTIQRPLAPLVVTSSAQS